MAAHAEPPALLLGRTGLAANAPTVTGVHSVLGLNGTAVPLDGAALDPIGLAYPLAAHSQQVAGGRVATTSTSPPNGSSPTAGRANSRPA